jgi:hypothetical protein
VKRQITAFLSLLIFTALFQSIALAQVSSDLGLQREGFGSSSQAQALLKLIESNPGQYGYQISYTTSSDTVVFGCDLARDSIVRIHQRPNGTGTGERWQGYARHRLQSAADGGSLNDTPAGKQPGVMQSF